MGGKDHGSGAQYRAMAQVSVVGLLLVACIVIGYSIGAYLDRRLHTEPYLMLAFVVLGTIAGFVEVSRTVKAVMRDLENSHRSG